MKVSGGKIIGVQPGTATITAISGDVKISTKVSVLGADELTSLTASNTTAPLTAGTTVSIPITAVTKDGQSITLPASSLKWEFVGFKGDVQGDQLKVNSVNANTKVGYAIGRYNGFSTVIVLSEASQSMWENFENVTYPVNFTTNVAQVTGVAAIANGSGDHSNSKVLSLQYDMTQGSGKMYAYAQLNGTAGKVVQAPATSMSVDVQGDNSLNWLRAELTDKTGKAVYVDLAKVIDWEGWKSLSIDLTGLNIQYPAQLKRLYVVNVEEGQDERSLSGSIAFDNIQFAIPSLSSESALPQGIAVMGIGQKSMTVNGNKIAMDVAPMVKDNSTYVPIRYVIDAFGGSANWDAANQRITVIRGGKLLDLTVNKKEFILNGKRYSAEVAPIATQSRTLVPLRLVSEQLGLTVNWDSQAKIITIES
ncbi:hypothetical protein D3C76_947880 [compost metagenome]